MLIFAKISWKITDWLTDYMEESSSWEADSSLASQEIHRNLWNANIHYHVYNSPLPVPILSQSNPVRVPTFFFQFHFNIIIPSTPESSKWAPSIRFPHQNPAYTFPLH